MTRYIVRIKERNNSNIITTTYSGIFDKQGIIAFFGLEQPDVESYTIQIAGTPIIYGHRKGIQG